MNTEQKIARLRQFCSGHRHTHSLLNTDREICPFEGNEFCKNYLIEKTPPEIIDQWYALFFGEDPTPVIKDSGSRQEFDTGAVRDIQKGKGRCDLMPLTIVGDLFAGVNKELFTNIHMFQKSGLISFLYSALELFASEYFDGIYTMCLEVAKHFEEGAEKYGENNWQKGLPVHCYINSAVRHLLKFLRGDEDEHHDRAFCWNVICCIWTCKFKPELNDYAKEIENAEN